MSGGPNALTSRFELKVNGAEHEIVARGETPVLFILRNDLCLNGPKYGCGLGQCGACSILVNGRSMRSCVLPLRHVVGRHILTLEGLGTPDHMHVVQSAFVSENAAQCGYCLNGMIITSVALLNNNRTPDETAVKQALRHNLCRCGAHKEIIAAVLRAAKTLSEINDRGPSHE